MAGTVSFKENRRILIVDDQASLHEDYRKILLNDKGNSAELDEMESALFGEKINEKSEMEFELTSAYQGSEAVEKVISSLKKGQPFAMAFVDIRMPPGMDGIETIKAIWELDPKIQVVICTAFSDYSWDETIETLGQTDQLLILKKPFDIIEVKQLASALVSKWNLTKQAKLNHKQLEVRVQHRTQQLTEQTNNLRETVKALKETKAQLFQADKLASIGQLAAGLAHEINNPIGYVSCNLNTLDQYLKDIHLCLAPSSDSNEQTIESPTVNETDDANSQTDPDIDLNFILEDIQDLMKDSLEGIDRVARIVGDLTDFSHVNSSERLPVNVNELIDKTINVARNQIKAKAVVTQDFQKVPEITVNGGQLGQVILNLLINACQAIPENGHINIRTSADDVNLMIEIEDNGKGIPEESRHKIFDPFFTSKPVGEGTGLGLHIVHNIITQHEGDISFTSTLDKGTCFTILLPITGMNHAVQSSTA